MIAFNVIDAETFPNFSVATAENVNPTERTSPTLYFSALGVGVFLPISPPRFFILLNKMAFL